jgi:hypothetical protein
MRQNKERRNNPLCAALRSFKMTITRQRAALRLPTTQKHREGEDKEEN